MTPQRLETLADGVFAIAMTLLVIELHVPEALATQGALLDALAHVAPKILTFVISFLVMAIYWVGHHYQFHNFRRVDRPFLWLNLAFLLLIALLPFSTAILGSYYAFQAAILLYGAHLVLIGLSFLSILLYATHEDRLVDAGFDPRIKRFAVRRILIAPAFALVAMAVSFVDPRVSFAVFILTLIPGIMPGSLDRLLSGRHEG